jgi:hypothetical protein
MTKAKEIELKFNSMNKIQSAGDIKIKKGDE